MVRPMEGVWSAECGSRAGGVGSVPNTVEYRLCWALFLILRMATGGGKSGPQGSWNRAGLFYAISLQDCFGPRLCRNARWRHVEAAFLGRLAFNECRDAPEIDSKAVVTPHGGANERAKRLTPPPAASPSSISKYPRRSSRA